MYLLCFYLNELINGWPLILFVGCMSIIVSFVIKFVQFRALKRAVALILFPQKESQDTTKEMTPLQAFINTLSTNLGNGSIAGTATALAAGGPGAAIWIVIIAFITMSVRFMEVYMSTVYSMKYPHVVLGGPMLYLKDIPGGSFLPLLYTGLCFLFALVGGNSIQANSISVGLQAATGLPALLIAAFLGLIVLYIMYGGAQRIIKISDYLVPIKVGVFFGAAFLVLLYHASSVLPALVLMIKAAFNINALGGALAGVTIQKTIQMGMSRSIFATESGLGTAAVLFGASRSKDPFESGLLGMMSTLVSSLVCFLVSLCIVASGVWTSGLTSTALTIAAFQTVFGMFGGLMVNFLAIVFGLGVIVSYGYIVKSCWAFLSNHRYSIIPVITYCLASFLGALGTVSFVWMVADFIMAGMLLINLYAVVIFAYRYASAIANKLNN